MRHPKPREARLATEDQEIELKFLCEPRDLEALLEAAPAGATEAKALRAIYFDTPDGRLRREHISLRVRESGGKRVQTLKRGEGFGREEYEQKVGDDRLDLTMPALKKALPAARRKALAPAFSVAVDRRQRTVAHGEAMIEIAADLGTITAGDRRREICELELELKAGSPSELFALARQLARTAPLYLSYEGKAAQGQMLGDGTELVPRSQTRVRLTGDLTAAAAFQAIARTTLGLIASNAALVRETADEAALHQLRVAVRRLRSAIATCAALVGDAEAPKIRSELKWLAGTCGEARDLDVFARSLKDLKGKAAADAALLTEAVAKARAKAYAKAGAALASGRFRDLVLAAAAWVETAAWLTDPDGKARRRREVGARAFARAALRERWKAWRRLAKDFGKLDAEGRHKLRIKAKNLRYAAEAFAPLFAARPAARMVGRIKRLQDDLGALNDAAVAARLVGGLRLDVAGREAAERIVTRRSRDADRGLKRAARSLDRLCDADRFWR
ncbi:CYTH and CHAD domain-containing protein [Phenylobacterium aquaticum]|uniref:CYTH and CHAD domain-containing protein n=1 Tax=Phenylobacterium aquaticum TaxID=1763816 RepID=UPI001F5C8793|nr:CYTH and CHAD domain-containing protein [Phenylobacterium aquaticum]MCI3134080.1 CHAD domain-containing protein [Phenylobacterium aquaticum]